MKKFARFPTKNANHDQMVRYGQLILTPGFAITFPWPLPQIPFHNRKAQPLNRAASPSSLEGTGKRFFGKRKIHGPSCRLQI